MKRLIVIILLVVPLAGSATADANKVEVCHAPPGNPDNFHTITISESALAIHLAHGDVAGACNEFCAQLCNDGDACTIDDFADCETAGCPAERTPVDCSDFDLCTNDLCDPQSGCSNPVAVSCIAPDMCTTSTCDPLTGSCEDVPVICETGESCDSSSGQCVSDHCVDVEMHCLAGSPVLQSFCGLGIHLLSANAAANVSYVNLHGGTTSLVLHHCVDGSALSGAQLEVFEDTSLCTLEGGCCGFPRWSDSVCAVEIR
jgi:hypothetical protein